MSKSINMIVHRRLCVENDFIHHKGSNFVDLNYIILRLYASALTAFLLPTPLKLSCWLNKPTVAYEDHICSYCHEAEYLELCWWKTFSHFPPNSSTSWIQSAWAWCITSVHKWTKLHILGVLRSCGYYEKHRDVWLLIFTATEKLHIEKSSSPLTWTHSKSFLTKQENDGVHHGMTWP